MSCMGQETLESRVEWLEKTVRNLSLQNVTLSGLVLELAKGQRGDLLTQTYLAQLMMAVKG